jgi:hypothetical protein
VLIFDERHEVHVVLAPDDENALAGVTAGIRVLQDVEQVAALDAVVRNEFVIARLRRDCSTA